MGPLQAEEPAVTPANGAGRAVARVMSVPTVVAAGPQRAGMS